MRVAHFHLELSRPVGAAALKVTSGLGSSGSDCSSSNSSSSRAATAAVLNLLDLAVAGDMWQPCARQQKQTFAEWILCI